MEGKASRNVVSACSRGERGRGGFGGGASSEVLVAAAAALFVVALNEVSCGSSSKSSGLAVVGDSGGAPEAGLFCSLSVDQRIGE